MKNTNNIIQYYFDWIGWTDNHFYNLKSPLISMRDRDLISIAKTFRSYAFRFKAKRCVFTMRMCHVKEFLCCVVFVFMILTCADDYSAFYCFTYFYFSFIFLPSGFLFQSFFLLLHVCLSLTHSVEFPVFDLVTN